MPTERRDRMFRDQERRLTTLRAQLASAKADSVYGKSDGQRRAALLGREIEVRERVLEELREVD